MKGGERMVAKRSTIGGPTRKTLGDITNLENPNNPTGANGDPTNSIHHLLKENSMLVKLIEERNKIIELSGNELGKLRMTVQKLQVQNWSLAQSNSQMLAELNSGKDRLKALQHELLCKEALLKVKKVEVKTKADTSCQDIGPREAENLPRNCSRNEEISTRPSDRCTRSSGRSKSLAPTTAHQQVEQEKVENKRLCLRRQSAKFKPNEQEPPDLFEIEDVKFPVTKLPDNPVHEDGPVISGSSVTKEGEVSDQRSEEQGSRRSSVGRPLRRAAEKVESYKEISLKVKLRRS